MQTSIVEVLKAAGLYKDPDPKTGQVTGRMAEQTLKTILPNGEVTEHVMGEIEYSDLKVLGDELDILLAYENPVIQHIFAKNAVAIANAVRVTNVETASGFKGAVGAGRQLDILMLRPEQFQDPALGAVGLRTTWVRIIGAPVPGTRQVICAQDAVPADTHGALTMTQWEALLLFGFSNPSMTPCTTAIQITYLAQQFNIQNAYFGLSQVTDSYYPFVELKEPLVLYPQESGLVEARYPFAATDELTPVGLWIKMSQNLRSLINS